MELSSGHLGTNNMYANGFCLFGRSVQHEKHHDVEWLKSIIHPAPKSLNERDTQYTRTHTHTKARNKQSGIVLSKVICQDTASLCFTSNAYMISQFFSLHSAWTVTVIHAMLEDGSYLVRLMIRLVVNATAHNLMRRIMMNLMSATEHQTCTKFLSQCERVSRFDTLQMPALVNTYPLVACSVATCPCIPRVVHAVPTSNKHCNHALMLRAHPVGLRTLFRLHISQKPRNPAWGDLDQGRRGLHCTRRSADQAPRKTFFVNQQTACQVEPSTTPHQLPNQASIHFNAPDRSTQLAHPATPQSPQGPDLRSGGDKVKDTHIRHTAVHHLRIKPPACQRVGLSATCPITIKQDVSENQA